MIKAKNSLGQNFLIDKNILEKIVNITSIKGKNILEIGPGTGNLTSFILKKKPQKLYVVEKDTYLANKLKDKYGKIKLTRDNQWFLNIYKVMFIVATFGIFYLIYSYCNDFDNSNQLSSTYITFLLIILLISTILPICNVINSNKLVKIAYSITS